MQVYAVHREIADSGRAQRAAVADAARQDSPCEWQLIAVAPDDLRHFEVMVGLHLADAVRREAGPIRSVPTLHCVKLTLSILNFMSGRYVINMGP